MWVWRPGASSLGIHPGRAGSCSDCLMGPTYTHWARAREDLRKADPTATAFALPVVVKTGGPAWTPLDSKAITRLADLVKSKGLRSPVTMSAVEALMASSLLPYDVVNLMRVILEPVQYTLWYDEWNRLLQVVVATATRDHRHPANGQGRNDRTNLARLQGLAEGMVGSPEGQATALRAGELAALTTAALQALRTVARVAEPVFPWTDIKQGPSESFSDFANRLIRAVEGSDLPKEVQPLVVIDCLKQKSLLDVQQIIRAAPGTLNTPGELIKYVLDHQKVAPLTNEGLVTAMQGMAASVSSAVRTEVMAAAWVGEEKDKGPCFKCGQRGHFKTQCPKRVGQEGLQSQKKRCQLCDRPGHVAHQCQKFKVMPQGNRRGRVPMAQGSFPFP
ncbi:endogenous retrovirus group K member 8 Gag polyprotein-like [Lagopus leucura]|uniref:endogenous retrovirus group K member 8 Gag polyprotein-like n=1 Tax=Lagopus leucura TaxID=30410 RepID=UPI001C6839EC|nr:endogenous retrovirus group K member 8 Gag polyprotein-like [Lagopus leucura]